MQNIRRIVVALDTSAHSHAALQEAAALAERLQAELVGVFVVDTELLRTSGLPAALETGATSASRRLLSPQAMERALQRQAKRAQAALEHVAHTHRIRTTFELKRGSVVGEVLAAAAGADLLALGRRGHMSASVRRIGSTVRSVTAQAQCSVLMLTPQPGGGQCVMVVYDHSRSAARALEYGLTIALRRNVELDILLCGTAEELPGLRSNAEASLANESMRVRFEEMQPDRLRNLPEIAKQRRCGLLVMPHIEGLIDNGDGLLDELSCPVLVTR
jgi:nucleotide-binding universal stress UspA family protein